MDWKFGLLVVINILFYLIVRATKKRKRLNGVLTFLFMTLVTLTVLEAGYRIFFKKKGLSETGNFSGGLNTPASLTGFTIKNIRDLHVTETAPNGDTIYSVGYGVMADTGFNRLAINHRVGYRAAPGRDSLELVFLGCSFTFATGVPDTLTMAYRVGKELDYPSVNLGGPGFGTHQVYQIFTHKYSNIPDHKKRVYIYTFIPDHILRAKCIYSWCLNDPYFVVDHDSLRLEGAAYKHTGTARGQVAVRLLSLNRMLSLVSDLGNNIVQFNGARHVEENDYTRVKLMLENMNRRIAAHGDRFIILYWDDFKGLKNGSKGYFVEPQKVNGIMDGLAAQGATVVKVSSFYSFDQPENFFPVDNHPSVKGNGILAREVGHLIQHPDIP